MTDAYNLTGIMNGSGTPAGFLQAANTLSGGLLGLAFTIVIFAVLLITYIQSGYTAKSSVTSALFITTLLSVLLYITGLLSWSVLMGYIILSALMVVLSIAGK